MVAVVVGLRLRQLGRLLSRSPWAIVSVVVGVLMGFGMLSLLLAGVGALRAAAPDAAAAVLALFGAVLTLGWAVGAVFFAADDALAPERFCLLPVGSKKFLLGVLVAGSVGIGGIVTALALTIGLIGWSTSPIALVAATLTAPVVLVTCVLAARTVAAVLGRQLANRRSRELVTIVGAALAIGSGLLLNAALRGLAALGDVRQAIVVSADVLSWTPLGAAWGVPLALEEGQPLTATGRLVIALATVAVLWIVWSRTYAARLSSPTIASGGTAVRTGTVIDRLVPASAMGAVAGRAIRYRFRDPRLILDIVGLVMVLVLLPGLAIITGPAMNEALIFSPLLGAFIFSQSVQSDTAHDNSALALNIHTGMSGRDDRAGRVLGIGLLHLPLIVLACLGCALLVGRLDLLPASLGAALGAALVGAGVSSAISPWLPGQAPAPGASPFGKGSSGGVQAMVGALIASVATLVLAGPAIGLAIAAMWDVSHGIWALVAGLVVGSLVLWGGLVLAGRWVDRRWPEILAHVSAE